MTLAEHTMPDVPEYSESQAPDRARAVALVDDFTALFSVLKEWGRVFPGPITGWATQTAATDLEHLPAELLSGWEEEHGTDLRLSLELGGRVRVADYRGPDMDRSLAASADVIVRA
ncbi:hypothetical protein ABZW10_28465 [Kitasatospora sp. NPDC004723]|uniref:hypothetical protein n=1 Tax=Kitasatospora sp. NPDC004723 TaxID=3154288 RepID=UPI0033B08B64